MIGSHRAAVLPISSASSRLAASSGASPSDLEEVGVADRLARLANQEQVGVVVGEHADRALVLDDLALDLLAVGEAEALDP